MAEQAQTAETDEQARERRRREHLALLLALLIATTRDSLHRLAEDLGAGAITVTHLGAMMLAVLGDAHAHAAYIGRQWAGVTDPFGYGDLHWGQLAAAGQQPFVAQLQADLHAGKLSPAQLKARLSLYAVRCLGTAQESWRLTLPPEELLWWDPDPRAKHCHSGRFGSCPELADSSPRPASEWPTDPGAGDTECLGNCRCSWRRESGDTGPMPAAEADETV